MILPSHFVDIVPTILDLAGQRTAPAWQGEEVPPLAGTSLARLSQANLASWNVHDLDISSFGAGPYPVTLRISAKNVSMRHFCFQAEVRK